MTMEKVDQFMLVNAKYFREEQVPTLRNALLAANEEKWNIVTSMQFKDPMVSLLLSLFLGGFGIDRFYIGDTGMGVGKLLTCGGVGIWALIDLFLIMGATHDKNYFRLTSML